MIHGLLSRYLGANRIAIGCIIVAFATVSASAQPPPAMPTQSECISAATNFNPADAQVVRIVIACDPQNAASNIARLSTTYQNRVVAAVRAPDASPVAYLLNGRLVPADASELRGVDFQSPSFLGVPVDRHHVVQASIALQQMTTNRTNAANAFNISAAADIAAQNQATLEAQQNSKFCAYRTNSISAATGLVSLASNAAVYTRSILGVLSLFAPIVFSKCEVTVPPAKPVPTLKSPSVKTGNTVDLAVIETGYNGTFSVSASAPDTVTIAPAAADPANPAASNFTITAQDTATIVTLTVTDDHGQSSTVALTITSS